MGYIVLAYFTGVLFGFVLGTVTSRMDEGD